MRRRTLRLLSCRYRSQFVVRVPESHTVDNSLTTGASKARCQLNVQFGALACLRSQHHIL
jgi:hypothetical protein